MVRHAGGRVADPRQWRSTSWISTLFGWSASITTCWTATSLLGAPSSVCFRFSSEVMGHLHALSCLSSSRSLRQSPAHQSAFRRESMQPNCVCGHAVLWSIVSTSFDVGVMLRLLRYEKTLRSAIMQPSRNGEGRAECCCSFSYGHDSCRERSVERFKIGETDARTRAHRSSLA